jgi:hypothetical protein
MATVTLAVLRARARERADMTSSLFVSDANFNLWINEAGQRLHEKLVDAMSEEYVEATTTFTTVAGTSDYALPATFLKLYAVDMNINGIQRTLKPFTRGARNALTGAMPAWNSYPKYRITGSNIRILPSISGGLTTKLYYAPVFTLLTTDASTVDFPNGWERLIVIEAAIQALMKEESDVSALRQEQSKMEGELEKIKQDRDLQFPQSAVDMDEINLDWRW